MSRCNLTPPDADLDADFEALLSDAADDELAAFDDAPFAQMRRASRRLRELVEEALRRKTGKRGRHARRKAK